MNTEKTAVLAFSAQDVITILMALEAAIMVAGAIGNKEEQDGARELRDRLIKGLSAQMAQNEKDATGATVN